MIPSSSRNWWLVPVVVVSVLGATPRALSAKLRVPQDFPTIQAAVLAAAEGDTIVVSKGLYPESVIVANRPGIEIRAKKGHKVTIDPPGSARPMEITSSQGVVLHGLRCAGGDAALFAQDADGMVVEDCRFSDADFGIELFDSSGYAIRDCRILHCEVALFAGSGNGVIEENRVKHCEKGMYVSGDGVSVRDNLLEQFTETGASVRAGISVRGKGVLAQGNEVRGVRANVLAMGIEVNPQAEHATVIDNTVADCDSYGIDLGGGDTDGHVVASNRVRSCGFAGIRLFDAASCLVAGNKIRKNGTSGIYLAGQTADATITGNVVRKSGDIGLRIESKTHTITFNDVRKSGLSDLSDSFFADNVYFGNVFGFVAP